MIDKEFEKELDLLISDMQEMKLKYSTLSIDQVLKIFKIKSMNDLSKGIRILYNK